MTIFGYLIISLCILIYLVLLTFMTKQIAKIQTLPDAVGSSFFFFYVSLISLIPNYYMSQFFKADIPFLYMGCEAFGAHDNGKNIITYILMISLMPIFIYYINKAIHKNNSI